MTRAASPVMTVFLANVTDRMNRDRITVAELARRTGRRRESLSAILHGRGGNCSLKTAEEIANALETQLHFLLKPNNVKG